MTARVADDVGTALSDLTATVAARAQALDNGSTDVRPDLTRFGEAAMFDAALHDDGLPELVRTIEHTSAVSLAVGFSVWAHTMTVTYLRHTAGPVFEGHLDALRKGARAGVTAMAAGLKQVAGLGPVPLIAHGRDRLHVSGPIQWASNVFEDALMVLPARRADGSTIVAAVDVDSPGVTVNRPPELMALGATASTSLRLHDVPIRADHVLSTDLTAFVAQIRPTFLVLQTAFCVGVANAALAGAQRATGVVAAQFGVERSELAERHRTLRDQLYRLATEPRRHRIVEFIRLRLDAATAAVAATRLESTLAGGIGYAAHSAVNRRFREAAFLPIQSPSEGQLRWELSRYE